jgi:hypothetical protein
MDAVGSLQGHPLLDKIACFSFDSSEAIYRKSQRRNPEAAAPIEIRLASTNSTCHNAS